MYMYVCQFHPEMYYLYYTQYIHQYEDYYKYIYMLHYIIIKLYITVYHDGIILLYTALGAYIVQS